VYCLAVEKLLGLEVPKRAQYIRVMMVELQRISSHLVGWGRMPSTWARCPFSSTAREREEILKIFEMFAGQRMMTSYIRIGGIALDPRGWRQAVDRFLKMMPSRVDEYETLLTENRIWIGRTKGIGYISCEDAIALSMSGPTIRAPACPTTTGKCSRIQATKNSISRADADRVGLLRRVPDSRRRDARKPEDHSPGVRQDFE